MTSDSSKSKRNQIIKKYLYMFAITVKWFVIVGIIGGCFAFGVAYGYASSLVKDDPVRSKEEIFAKIRENAVAGFVYFNDGSLVGQIRSDQNRRLVTYDEIPRMIIEGFIAVEDNNFNSHLGVDLKGFTRAFLQKVTNQERQTGGSTITQQLARQVFLTLDPTVTRKAKEILLALRMERYMSKNEIMEAYLNKIPFGNGSSGYYTYGIKAAAQGIFNIENLHHLNIAQIAYLVGLPQDPNGYSAYNSDGSFNEERFNKAMKRQRFVLKRMLEEGKITESEYEDALRFDIKSSLAPTQPKAYVTYPFLMIEAERKAAETLLKLNDPSLTEEDFRKKENANLISEAIEELRRGYKIHTTIDKTIYDAMQEIAKTEEYFLPDHPEKGMEQIGAIMIENKTGAILGMIEGRDFYKEQLNHATQMRRQPGSAMKPIAAFLPAIEMGYIQPASIIDDIPIIFEDGGKGYHIPNNWNLQFQGLITARHALNQSYNIPALYLYNEVVTIEKALDFAKSLGITTITENDYNYKTGVIGGLDYGTTVEELANAYSAIPNQGVFNDAYMIQKIEDPSGKVVYEHEPNPKTVFSPETAYIMTDMLRTVITSGTATSIRSTFKNYGKIPIAGKTGSTNNDHDAWFIGYTPDITVGVWAGYDEPSTLLISQGAGHRAKNIWSYIMDKALELKPEMFVTEQFEKPDTIVSRTVSRLTGKLPSDITREANLLVTDIFNIQHVPDQQENNVYRAKVVNYKGMNYIPLASTPEDMVRERIVVEREQNIGELMQRLEQILNSMSYNNRPKKRGGALMTIEDYYPLDMHLTAPVQVDPRQDDGKPPAPPTGLEIIKVDDTTLKITFQHSPSEDVVGYRFYRSFGGRPFVHSAKQNVLIGDKTEVIDYISPQYEHAYFITAVDVAGNESEPSQIVSTSADYGHGDLLIPPIQNPSENEIGDPGHGDTDGGDPTGDETPGNAQNNHPSENEQPGNDQGNQRNLPSPPQGLRIHESDNKMMLTWNANPRRENVIRYHIYHKEEQDGEYKKVGSTNMTNYESDKEGWYMVVAENHLGMSEPSTPVKR